MQTKKAFGEVTARPHLPQLERELMELWEREGTYRASLDSRRGGPRWVFYEGPPTANGRPGTHHVLARAFKDLFPRYRTMKGCYVERKAGWDTHGLPVELEVEKKLGISGKRQIEELGIERFNELCRASVYEYVDAWTDASRRMGFWQDYDDAYWTLTSDYIQSVWWALKTMWDRGLVYKGFRVAPYCPRCMTSLSSHELALGYQDDVPDPSVFVRFRLKHDPTTSLLAWTTTPWTLPGNVALAVAGDVDYVRVRQGGEYLVLAEARLDVLEGEYEVVERMRGADLVGLDYEPLYTYLPPKERAWYVVSADFVSVAEGTGIVHTAAAYGADDLRLCQEKGIPVRHTVDLRGRFLPEVEKFAGQFVKEADPQIVEDLRERGLLYRVEEVRHTYPFCWRCDTPLIYYALDSWYVGTTALRDELVANNAATNWVPAHIRDGRMGDWLANNVDWAISRSRYWGTPLPFWVCGSCDARRCVASAEELGLDPESDLHRPYIDAVELPCECGGTMQRVPEVLDCWFDSGSMPFAQRGYPRTGQEAFESTFPADFICEAIDQTRGWFYSLLAISTMLFHRNAYRNVICLGHVLDPVGRKASKSRGNVLDPWYLFDTFGADALRWFFYTGAPVGEPYRTGEKELQEVVRQFLLTLWNVYSFFVTYANLDGFVPDRAGPVALAERPALDRWLLSRLSHLVETVDRSLDRYDVTGAARPIEAFVEDLSNWYVRRSRRRFWKAESDTDKLAAYQTLHETLVTLSRLLAPFTPFLADAIHRNLCDGRSVHLADFPVPELEARDTALETEMAQGREAVQAGLAARDAARIKVRQPLPALTITRELLPEVAAIVRDELNVKELRVGGELALDTTITDELRLEGMARDAVRLVQDLRKRSGLQIEDRIRLWHEGGEEWARVFERFGALLAAETLAVEVHRGRSGELLDGEAEGGGLWTGLKRA
ncbi:MAG TPA: isoleucine--tRNA ligase [Candidatus Dormibacteraeota bacterium]|nr:isoleucine--tRNA ligase [Candidatus Dormibacteraeota bacterium]